MVKSTHFPKQLFPVIPAPLRRALPPPSSTGRVRNQQVLSPHRTSAAPGSADGISTHCPPYAARCPASRDSKPTLPGCALPPYAKRRRSLPCGTACPAVRRGPARRTAAAAGRAVRLWSDPDHTVAARRTFPRIRFGIHALLPLHSCLGTRRLSSVGRASHS